MSTNDRPWLLFFCGFVPAEPIDGSHVYVWSMMQWLRQHYRIGLFLPWRQEVPAVALEGVDGLWCGADIPGLSRLHWRLQATWQRAFVACAGWRDRVRHGALRARFPSGTLSHVEPSVVLAFERLCRRLRPAATIVVYAQMAVPVLAAARAAGSAGVICTVDVMHQRHALMEAQGVEAPLRVTREVESMLLREADALIAIQAEEAGVLRELVPDRPIVVAGCPVRVHALPPSDPSSRRLLIVAGAGRHNLHGLTTFLDEVWPRVCAASPGVTLDLCGGACKELAARPSGWPQVNLLGYRDDLAPHYRDAALVLNVTRFGSGLKIKSVDALAHGRCLVTTPVGAQGLEDARDRALVVCPPEAMPERIAALLDDPSERHAIEAAALAFARERFSPDYCFRALGRLLEDVARG